MVELPRRLDARPGARSDALQRGTDFRRLVQSGFYFLTRVDRGVIQYLWIDIGVGREIVVRIVDVVGDLGDDPRLEHEVQELVSGVWMRCPGGDQQCVE